MSNSTLNYLDEERPISSYRSTHMVCTGDGKFSFAAIGNFEYMMLSACRGVWSQKTQLWFLPYQFAELILPQSRHPTIDLGLALYPQSFSWLPDIITPWCYVMSSNEFHRGREPHGAVAGSEPRAACASLASLASFEEFGSNTSMHIRAPWQINFPADQRYGRRYVLAGSSTI